MQIRLEREGDFRAVENLVREAFWNVYRPGCSEHYLLNRLRGRPEFIPQLDYLLEDEGQIVAQILYCRSRIDALCGRAIPTVTFGPVSVLPPRQRQGCGGALIRYTLSRAAALGYGAAAITGDPIYYRRFGFVSGASLDIACAGAPADFPFFLVKELAPGYLSGVRGVFAEPEGYRVDEAEAAAFDRTFPPKEKRALPGQLFGV